jgi:hypothetical protein
MINRITQMARKMPNKNFEISTAPSAIPENPNTAATRAIRKKIAAHFKNIIAPSLPLKVSFFPHLDFDFQICFSLTQVWHPNGLIYGIRWIPNGRRWLTGIFPRPRRDWWIYNWFGFWMTFWRFDWRLPFVRFRWRFNRWPMFGPALEQERYFFSNKVLDLFHQAHLPKF